MGGYLQRMPGVFSLSLPNISLNTYFGKGIWIVEHYREGVKV